MARNWYPFYPGDYARKTQHLSLMEHGAYRLLMDYYYSSGKPLPNDERILFRICGATNNSERKSVRSVLTYFFSVQVDSVRNGRIDSELAKSLEYSEAQSAKAKLRHNSGLAVQGAGDMPARAFHNHNHNTGTKVPSAESAPEEDLDSIIFGAGLKYLVNNTGRAEPTLRSMLGKWRKAHGGDETLLCLREAQKHKVAEPISYIEAMLQERSKPKLLFTPATFQ